MRNRKNNFTKQVRNRRRLFGRKGLRRRAGVWLHPTNMERMYKRRLEASVAEFEAIVTRELIERLPALKQEADALLRGDDFLDDLKRILDALAVTGAAIFQNAESMAAAIGAQTAEFNAEQYRRILQATVGVTPMTNEPWLRVLLKNFAEQNAKLIQSLPTEVLKDVEGIARRGLTGGLTVNDMEKEIRARFKTTKARARLIARDQVGKLNAQLTEKRQTQLGIEEYIWNSMDDERVRPSHSVLDGLICRWDDPTVYRRKGETQWRKRGTIGGYIGHPGTDYQCRCFGEPIMEEFIDEE